MSGRRGKRLVRIKFLHTKKAGPALTIHTILNLIEDELEEDGQRGNAENPLAYGAKGAVSFADDLKRRIAEVGDKIEFQIKN